MSAIKTICILLLILITGETLAEYRVYQYMVTPTFQIGKKSTPYIVTSSLNPVAYLAYNGGSQSMNIELLRTWPCMGYTGSFKEFCKSTEQIVLENTTEPK